MNATRVAALILVSALLAAPALAKGACPTPEEVKAAQVRQFHYELQVAALNCRDDNPALPGKWASYVQRHGAALSDNARVLHAYFQRSGKGAAGFDRHNTIITNRESVRVHEVPNYCDSHEPLFDKAVQANTPQLTALAGETVGKPDDFAACAEPHKAEPHKAQKPKAKKKNPETARAD